MTDHLHIYSPETNRCAICFARYLGHGFGEATDPDKAYQEDILRITQEFAERLTAMPSLYTAEGADLIRKRSGALSIMRTLQYRSDGGDFAEIWIDGELSIKLNSDEDDLGTAGRIFDAIAASSGVSFSTDSTYEYDQESGSLVKP